MMRCIPLIVGSLLIANLDAPALATQTIYKFTARPTDTNSSYFRSFGTFTVAEDFNIQSFDVPINHFLPISGRASLEIFGQKINGIDRGYIAFGAISWGLRNGFLIGGARGGVTYTVPSITSLSNLGGTNAVFNLSNFSSVVAHIVGQEDHESLGAVYPSIRGNFF